MRKISKNELGSKLVNLLNEVDPVEEDIGIISDNGNIEKIIIGKSAYDFLIRKVEEEEDKMDLETVDDFNKSGENINEKRT